MTTMTATLSVLLLVSASLGAAQAPRPSSGDPLRAAVKTYLEIQTLLAQDKFEDLKGPAGTLSSQTAALGNDGADLAKAATAFAAARDIKLARDAFGPLSDALIARVRADRSPDLASDLRVGYCPMVRRSWVQRDGPVRNPYYGAAMLTCGSVQPVNAPPGK